MKKFKLQAKAILARARTENRSMTDDELEQLRDCNRAQAGIYAHSALLNELQKIKREAKYAPLTSWHLKTLKVLARAGFPEAQELLQKALAKG
jgi:hypothetical protein